jgi:hypothetical protein
MSFPFLLSLAVTLAGQIPGAAERRALEYLAREVPRWSAEHQCYSCHNNGDAARALYRAIRLSYPIPADAIADTSRWLARPRRWDHNKGDAAFSDKGLARIQFAAALVEAIDANQVNASESLLQAAQLVAEGQRADGSWRVETGGIIGSPVTYGSLLATVQARHVLQRADPKKFTTALARADRWFLKVDVETVMESAALLLALEGSTGTGAQERRRHCVTLIRKGESPGGGWGPYVHSPAEPFDTAVVLLALWPSRHQPDVKPLIERGRAYLVRTQRADGSWPETTRPAGLESYAQRISTTGWATQALLATRDHSK